MIFFSRKQKGQSLVEYAIIGVAVILVLIIASKGVDRLMKNQVESTKKGLSSESFLKK